MSNEQIVKGFHGLYCNSRVWSGRTNWLGVPCLKCPLDLWIFQEIIFEVKPDIIIETGTYKGGTTLFLANVCDSIGKGKIITIDIKDYGVPEHKRITYLIGSSTSDEIKNEVENMVNENDKVMVILDSAHGTPHVLKEIRIYGPLVTKGGYLIVEDTSDPDPRDAVEQFLKEDGEFEVDSEREKFFLTFNHGGYLRKK